MHDNLSNKLPTDFDGWWNVPDLWVEVPNQRRNGWSGMIRLKVGNQNYYVKKQCNHLCRSPRHPFGWPTVIREYENIVRLSSLGVRVPNAVFHGVRRGRTGIEAILVTEELEGFSSLRDQTGLEQALREILAKEIGRVLGTMHRAHLQHSSLYDKHIMIRWQDTMPEVALIDLEKLRKPFFPWRAAYHDLEQLKRRQSVWSESEWEMLVEAHG